MAETFTSDNSPDTEVLTAEEQDSLEVGEQLVSEQEGLLAGKYKNAEDFRTSLLIITKETWKRRTEYDYEESDEGYAEEEETDEEVSEYAPAVSLIMMLLRNTMQMMVNLVKKLYLSSLR